MQTGSSGREAGILEPVPGLWKISNLKLERCEWLTRIKTKVPRSSEKSLTKVQEYFYANLLFWGFLLAAALISFFTCGGVWDDVTSGVMEFIFVIMGWRALPWCRSLDYFYESYLANPASGSGEKMKSFIL